MIDSPVCEYICENLRRNGQAAVRTMSHRCDVRVARRRVHRACRDAQRNGAVYFARSTQREA